MSSGASNINDTYIIIFRLKTHGTRFELMCRRQEVEKLLTDDNRLLLSVIDDDAVLAKFLQKATIYTNARKKEIATQNALQSAFGSDTTIREIIMQILSKGDIVETQRDRNTSKQTAEQLKEEIFRIVPKMLMNPFSGVHPESREVIDAINTVLPKYKPTAAAAGTVPLVVEAGYVASQIAQKIDCIRVCKKVVVTYEKSQQIAPSSSSSSSSSSAVTTSDASSQQHHHRRAMAAWHDFIIGFSTVVTSLDEHTMMVPQEAVAAMRKDLLKAIGRENEEEKDDESSSSSSSRSSDDENDDEEDAKNMKKKKGNNSKPSSSFEREEAAEAAVINPSLLLGRSAATSGVVPDSGKRKSVKFGGETVEPCFFTADVAVRTVLKNESRVLSPTATTTTTTSSTMGGQKSSPQGTSAKKMKSDVVAALEDDDDGNDDEWEDVDDDYEECEDDGEDAEEDEDANTTNPNASSSSSCAANAVVLVPIVKETLLIDAMVDAMDPTWANFVGGKVKVVALNSGATSTSHHHHHHNDEESNDNADASNGKKNNGGGGSKANKQTNNKDKSGGNNNSNSKSSFSRPLTLLPPPFFAALPDWQKQPPSAEETLQFTRTIYDAPAPFGDGVLVNGAMMMMATPTTMESTCNTHKAGRIDDRNHHHHNGDVSPAVAAANAAKQRAIYEKDPHSIASMVLNRKVGEAIGEVGSNGGGGGGGGGHSSKGGSKKHHKKNVVDDSMSEDDDDGDGGHRGGGRKGGKKKGKGAGGGSASSQQVTLLTAQYEKKTHKELQDLCKKRGMSSGGKKEDLVDRLVAGELQK